MNGLKNRLEVAQTRNHTQWEMLPGPHPMPIVYQCPPFPSKHCLFLWLYSDSMELIFLFCFILCHLCMILRIHFACFQTYIQGMVMYILLWVLILA